MKTVIFYHAKDIIHVRVRLAKKVTLDAAKVKILEKIQKTLTPPEPNIFDPNNEANTEEHEDDELSNNDQEETVDVTEDEKDEQQMKDEQRIFAAREFARKEPLQMASILDVSYAVGPHFFRIYDEEDWCDMLFEKPVIETIYINHFKHIHDLQRKESVRDDTSAHDDLPQEDALISTACLINNNTVKTHGYTPRQLRMNGGSNILLDVALRLKTVKHISHADYITEGVVDYDKFKDALSRINKFILEHAKETKLKHLNKRNLKNDEVIDITFKINDYVSYTAPPTAKKISRHKYGWQVIKRLDEKHFIIRNIFTSEQIKANYGHIKLFHKPLSSFKKSVENEITRLMNL
eukprot:491940_1